LSVLQAVLCTPCPRAVVCGTVPQQHSTLLYSMIMHHVGGIHSSTQLPRAGHAAAGSQSSGQKLMLQALIGRWSILCCLAATLKSLQQWLNHQITGSACPSASPHCAGSRDAAAAAVQLCNLGQHSNLQVMHSRAQGLCAQYHNKTSLSRPCHMP